MKLLTESEVEEKIFWYFRNNFVNQRDAAKKYQCSPAFISAVVNRKKQPTKQMMKDIGMKKISGYVEIT